MAQFRTNIGKATRLVSNGHIMACVNKSGVLSSTESMKSYNDKFWLHKDETNIISHLYCKGTKSFQIKLTVDFNHLANVGK
jgi:hypothetical protein